ncbi:MAG: Txe/YoeB family addiction module toxin [Deltaproteobacteria bacterium]
MIREVLFHQQALDDFNRWQREKPSVYERIRRLIKDTTEHPFEGIGKPEPLRHELAGHWSRRITEEHRLVYKVTDQAIIIASCRYHY